MGRFLLSRKMIILNHCHRQLLVYNLPTAIIDDAYKKMMEEECGMMITNQG